MENCHGVYIDEFARIEVSASGERERERGLYIDLIDHSGDGESDDNMTWKIIFTHFFLSLFTCLRLIGLFIKYNKNSRDNCRQKCIKRRNILKVHKSFSILHVQRGLSISLIS